MKFRNLLNFIKNNKFILLFFIVVLIILLNIKQIKEGLTGMDNIGEYDFLAPNNEDLSEDTWKSLIDKYNSINKTMLNYPVITELRSFLFNNISDIEAKYYINNGYFPYDQYVINFFNTKIKNNEKYKNINISGVKLADSDALKQLQQKMNNRSFYSSIINISTEIQKEAESSLANKIFMGTAQPPNNSQSLSSSNNSSIFDSPLSISSSNTLSSSNSSNKNNYYNEFVSLCKKVNTSN